MRRDKIQRPIQIRDPIYGTIHISADEMAVVESAAYQRLRGIRQLGFTDQAFPGATHTRFAHGLGAMEMAGRIFDTIFPLEATSARSIRINVQERARLRQILRLSVLLHDVGHAPLSHASEKCMPGRSELGLDDSGINVDGPGALPGFTSTLRATHEDYSLLIILNSELSEIISRTFGPHGIDLDAIAYLISNRVNITPGTFVAGSLDFGPILSQIVSSELDADRADYLQRDSYYAGVNYGKFDSEWLVNNLEAHIENGSVFLAFSHRAIFSFEDFLLSRYHMFVSVYYHHTAIGIDAMFARLIADDAMEWALPAAVAPYLEEDDLTFWARMRSSTNAWARRIVGRNFFRRILELNTEQETIDLTRLQQALDSAGVEFFLSHDQGVLSKYYRYDDPGRPKLPIYVLNHALESICSVEHYSRLFARYAQPTELTRVYCNPSHLSTAKDCLNRYLPQRQRQLVFDAL